MAKAGLRVQMDLKKLDQFVQEFPAMHHRMSNWRPVGEDLHDLIIQDYKAMYKTKRGRIGEMQRLGPSFTQKNHPEHYWRIYETAVEFGTTVPYSIYYEKWRDGNGRRSHLQFRARAKKSVANRIMDWVVFGR